MLKSKPYLVVIFILTELAMVAIMSFGISKIISAQEQTTAKNVAETSSDDNDTHEQNIDYTSVNNINKGPDSNVTPVKTSEVSFTNLQRDFARSVAHYNDIVRIISETENDKNDEIEVIVNQAGAIINDMKVTDLNNMSPADIQDIIESISLLETILDEIDAVIGSGDDNANNNPDTLNPVNANNEPLIINNFTITGIDDNSFSLTSSNGDTIIITIPEAK